MKRFLLAGMAGLAAVPFVLLVSFSSPSEINCSVANHAFSPGEELTYQMYYNWGFIWLNAGEVTFKVEQSEFKGNPCYHVSGIGGTYPSYDWIYKVRDRYECWLDSATLKPYRYIRDIREGGKSFYNECYYSFSKGKAYCVTREKGKSRLDTVSIGSCTFDALTMIYFTRTMDYSRYRYNDTIPISFFLDNKTYPLYIRTLGKDKLKLEELGSFNCIKFRPKLMEGTIFKGGEGMTVWATDDKNQIPLYVEAPILVGSVKAQISSWKNLRNKFEAKAE